MFDGVHIGHQRLLADAVALAESAGSTPVAVTFDRDPETVLRPDRAPGRLLDNPDRYSLILEQGIDTVLVIPFDEHLAGMPAEDFLDEVLCGALDLDSLLV